MKTAKIAILAAAVVAAAMFGGGAYGFLGGADPSRNMGNYRSFSFYADRPGNAASAWLQPGSAPPNPWDEFWFDDSGNLNLPGGLRTPGPVSMGTTTQCGIAGAAANGTIDDTSALSAAFAKGGVIDGLGKNYGVSGPLIIPAYTVVKNMTLVPLDVIDPYDILEPGDYTLFENVQIIAPRQSMCTAVAFSANTMYVTFNDCRFQYCHTWLSFTGSGMWFTSLMFRNCQVYGANTYIYVDGAIEGVWGTQFSQCNFDFDLRSSAGAAWQANHVYGLSASTYPITPNGYFYQVTAGVPPYESGSTEPYWPTIIGQTVNDGNLTWTCMESTQCIFMHNAGTSAPKAYDMSFNNCNWWNDTGGISSMVFYMRDNTTSVTQTNGAVVNGGYAEFPLNSFTVPDVKIRDLQQVDVGYADPSKSTLLTGFNDTNLLYQGGFRTSNGMAASTTGSVYMGTPVLELSASSPTNALYSEYLENVCNVSDYLNKRVSLGLYYKCDTQQAAHLGISWKDNNSVSYNDYTWWLIGDGNWHFASFDITLSASGASSLTSVQPYIQLAAGTSPHIWIAGWTMTMGFPPPASPLPLSPGLFSMGVVGASVASATTITPSAAIFPITGTVSVSLINIPWSGWTGTVTMIPSAATPFATGGTQSGLAYPIGAAFMATANVPVEAVFDGTHWWLK